MTLRYIPNNTKLNPMQMLIKAARDADHRDFLKRQRKLISFDYLWQLRKTMGMIFSDNMLINDFLQQFMIDDKNIKKQIEEQQKSLIDQYFSNGEFNKVRFEQDFHNLLSSLSSKFDEIEPTNIVLNIIDKNELKNGELINPIQLNDIDEYKLRNDERSDEIKFLTMYMASASDKEIKNIKDQRANSEILEAIMARDEFMKLKNSYHHDINKAVKNDKQNYQTVKLRLA